MLGKIFQRKNRSRLVVGCILILLLVCTCSLLLVDAGLRSYPAEQDLLRAAYSDSGVAISQYGGYYKIESTQVAASPVTAPQFDTTSVDTNSGSGEQTSDPIGVIFYPGGLVSPESYLDPLVKMVVNASKRGLAIQVYLTRPPLNLAVIDYAAAEKIIYQESQIKDWVVGGHSLGGAMACRYAASASASSSEVKAKIKGIFLLAAYCDVDVSSRQLKAISIYGTNDQVLNRELLEQYSQNLPADSPQQVITGMNHAQFGAYGVQRGDGPAQISLQTAQDKWISELNDWLKPD